jgi:hypothetical protein
MERIKMARLTRRTSLETGKSRGKNKDNLRKAKRNRLQERFDRLAGPVTVTYKKTL